MVKDTSTNYNTNINSSNTSNNTGFSVSTNTNNQDFNQSINRTLDQTKDNIKRSIDESRKQIPQYNNIVNNYQEQALQATKEITENYIESQKSIIKSFHSAWSPYQQNFNNKVTYLRTTNNLVFAGLDAYKTTMKHAKENTKQILDINTKTAQTFEQNSREVARAAQDANSRFNTSVNSGSGSSNTGTSTSTTSTSAA